MLGPITLPSLPADQLWLVAMACAAFALVATTVRSILFRPREGVVRAMPARAATTVSTRSVTQPPAHGESRLDENAQLERLFAVVARSAAIADRMLQAQDAAARHLDSAEYQLQRLFEEFPVLMAARAKIPVLGPSPLRAAVHSAPALAA